MHPVNRVLKHVGLTLGRTDRRPSRAQRQQFRRFQEQMAQSSSPLIPFFYGILENWGEHPISFQDVECAFASNHLLRIRPKTILDIGSYRQFVIGMLSHYDVTTVDVRGRAASVPNETVITCDAKHLALSDNSIDAIVSLCAIEHFGLGRYGDEIDVDADRKALSEIVRVLKPGGSFLFSTTITRGAPSVAFNAHRIYDYSEIERSLLQTALK